jgi:hypothetical protein
MPHRPSLLPFRLHLDRVLFVVIPSLYTARGPREIWPAVQVGYVFDFITNNLARVMTVPDCRRCLFIIIIFLASRRSISGTAQGVKRLIMAGVPHVHYS